MKQHTTTLNIDNKRNKTNDTIDIDTKQKSSTTNLQRRLALISKKLNLCCLSNVK